MRAEDLVKDEVYYDTTHDIRVVFSHISDNSKNFSYAVVYSENVPTDQYFLLPSEISQLSDENRSNSVTQSTRTVPIFGSHISQVVGSVQIDTNKVPHNFILNPVFSMEGNLMEVALLSIPCKETLQTDKRQQTNLSKEPQKNINAIMSLEVNDGN